MSFFHSPDHILSQCPKNQFLKIAEHYDIEISDKGLRESLKRRKEFSLVLLMQG